MPEPFVIQRQLQAPRELVWELLTQPQHRPHWLGPKGCSRSHSTLDFRVGGSFRYCLQMPNGPQMWGQWHLREIEAPHRLAVVQNFSDAQGGITRHPLAPTWPQRGWSGNLDVLEDYLARLQSKT